MKLLNLLTLHLLAFIFPLYYSSSDLQWYDSCGHNFTCGNVNVGFPFWGGSSRPMQCGYPEFQLTCESVIRPIIQIAKMSFYVLEINQTTKVLKLARKDLTDGLCLQKFENTTLNFQQFSYAPRTKNITLMYGCPAPIGDQGDYTGRFMCRINGVNETIGLYQSGATGPNGCYASFVVPLILPKLEIQKISGTISLSKAVNDEFEAKYKVHDQDASLCAKCEALKSRCGFDLVKNNAICHFPHEGTDEYKPGSTKEQISITPEPAGNTKDKRCGKFKILLPACLSAAGLCMLLILLLYVIKRFSSNDRKDEVSRQENKAGIEALLRHHESSGQKRYTYTDLKKITSSFKDKLGEGGYGSVYKGQLQNGNLVAVKILHKYKVNSDEFINEVESIGYTNHVNIVKLLGFCYEGHRRALVYELMVNGSLEKFLHNGNNHQSLGLETLFKIAIGIARGLEYLHRGCNTRILHFDIKPHNILLDEKFCPKISDFGLAKSCSQKDSIMLSMSEARGTVGYIAPEVFLKSFGGVSYKSDVYSYGMLVLEMVGFRRKPDNECELSSEQYFPEWIYKQLEREEEPNKEGIFSCEEREMQRKMIIVSLWCVKTNPSSRPAMSKVVEMLEGTYELQIPPASSLSLPSSPRSQDSQVTTLDRR